MSIKKKLAICGLSLFLGAASVLTFIHRDARAAEKDNKAVRILGLVNRLDGSSLARSKKITREEFSKMLITFSKEKKMVKSASKKKLFKDVRKKNKYKGYINAASIKGYMRGYSNGTFAGKKPVTMRMAAYSTLKLLGYTEAELLPLGSSELMLKFNSLQLNKNINKQADDRLSGDDCIELIVNLLYAVQKDGNILGKSLGYKFNQDGSLDSHGIILGNNKLIIAQHKGASAIGGLPVSKAYRNDKVVDISAIEKYDFIYYNRTDKVVYAYSDKVYGQLNEIQPSVVSAKSVLIGGKPYELAEKPIYSSTSASLSDSNIDINTNPWRTYFNKQQMEIGDYVVGIKDLDGNIAAVYKQEVLADKIIGYVIGNETKKIGNGNGGFDIVNVMILATTTGAKMEVPNPNIAIGTGNIVRVIYDVSGKPLVTLDNSSGGSLNGKEHLFSDELRAIEVNEDSFAAVLPGAIKSLDLSKVRAEYIGYNSKGEIVDLILKDALGVAYKYGIITDNQGSSIEYLDKGANRYSAYDTGFYLDFGKSVVALGFKENKLNTIKPLEEVTFSRIDGNIAFSPNGSNYTIADDVDVYYKSFGEWKYDSLKDMKDITGHRVKGYYLGSSNIIRVIIIEK